eukprot:884943-Lingulodinium_polyedra.AAC.1
MRMLGRFPTRNNGWVVTCAYFSFVRSLRVSFAPKNIAMYFSLNATQTHHDAQCNQAARDPPC